MRWTKFDEIATDRASLLMLHRLVKYLQPKLIIEAGTYKGHFCIEARLATPKSEIWTADPYKLHAGLPAGVRFIQDDFEALLAHLEPASVDFAFIDSGPPMEDLEEGVRLRHWEACKPYMRPGGIMACHDTNSTDWTGAQSIIDESIQLTGGRGLAIWQKC